MTCPITVRLGVYALGAADAAERMLVESHLNACRECRAELAGLQPLPGLLARVPPSLIPAHPMPARLLTRAPLAPITRRGNTRAGSSRARDARTAARRWRSAVAVAAATAVGVAGGYWLARPETSQPAAKQPATITLSGANPATHVRATVTLAGTSWGTSIRLLVWGLPLNQPCRLFIRSRTGGTEVAGAWDAWRAGPISIPASAAWRPADISSLLVATTSKNLVTISAVRPGAHAAASSLKK